MLQASISIYQDTSGTTPGAALLKPAMLCPAGEPNKTMVEGDSPKKGADFQYILSLEQEQSLSGKHLPSPLITNKRLAEPKKDSVNHQNRELVSCLINPDPTVPLIHGKHPFQANGEAGRSLSLKTAVTPTPPLPKITENPAETAGNILAPKAAAAPAPALPKMVGNPAQSTENNLAPKADAAPGPALPKMAENSAQSTENNLAPKVAAAPAPALPKMVESPAQNTENNLAPKADAAPAPALPKMVGNSAQSTENNLAPKADAAPPPALPKMAESPAQSAENTLAPKVTAAPPPALTKMAENSAQSTENNLAPKVAAAPAPALPKMVGNTAQSTENNLAPKVAAAPAPALPTRPNNFPEGNLGNSHPLPPFTTKPVPRGEMAHTERMAAPDRIIATPDALRVGLPEETVKTRGNLQPVDVPLFASNPRAIATAAYNPPLREGFSKLEKSSSSSPTLPDPTAELPKAPPPPPEEALAMIKATGKSAPTPIPKAGRDGGETRSSVKTDLKINSPSPGFTVLDEPSLVQTGAPMGKEVAAGNPSHPKFPAVAPQLLAAVEKLHQTIPGRIKIVLQPPELGTVDIYLRWKDKNLSLTIIADNDPAQQALLSNGNLLRNSLQSHGISIDHLEIALRGETSPNDSGPGLPWSTGRERDDQPVFAYPQPDETSPPDRYEYSDDHRDNYRGMGVNILV